MRILELFAEQPGEQFSQPRPFISVAATPTRDTAIFGGFAHRTPLHYAVEWVFLFGPQELGAQARGIELDVVSNNLFGPLHGVFKRIEYLVQLDPMLDCVISCNSMNLVRAVCDLESIGLDQMTLGFAFGCRVITKNPSQLNHPGPIRQISDRRIPTGRKVGRFAIDKNMHALTIIK